MHSWNLSNAYIYICMHMYLVLIDHTFLCATPSINYTTTAENMHIVCFTSTHHINKPTGTLYT